MSGLRTTLLAAALVSATAGDGAAQGRLRPAPFVTCDRDHLTSFTGRVVALTRQPSVTTLALDTDEGTSERFTIRHAGADASAWFFSDGQPFTAADWAALLPDGRLRGDARATVWVCDTRPNPWVDVVPAPARAR